MSFWSRISSSVGAATHKPAAGGVPTAADPAEPQADSELTEAAKARLDHLFRYSRRHGTINPLLFVLIRFRAQDPQ